MSAPLLPEILACGERLRAAVEAEDVEQAAALAAERGALVERLLAETTPAMHAADEVETLAAQHRSLMALLHEHGTTLQDASASLARQRQARASYDRPTPRPGILRTLHG